MFTCDPDFDKPPELNSPLSTWVSWREILWCPERSLLLNREKMLPFPLFLLRYVQRWSILRVMCVTLRKVAFCSQATSGQDHWPNVSQTVVSVTLQQKILRLPHYGRMAGQGVVAYCKLCHVWQIVGKTVLVSLYRLYLLLANLLAGFWSTVLVICSKQRMVTYVSWPLCAVTHFPEAIPLRRITAPSVVKVLGKFFLTFGLPQIMQLNQGYKQVL